MYKTLFSVCLDVVDYVTKDDDDMMCFFQSSSEPYTYRTDRRRRVRSCTCSTSGSHSRGGGWPIVMLENRLKPSEEGRGRRWRLRRSPTATSHSTTSPPSVAAVVKAHTTHLCNACFNCFSRGAEFLEFIHRLNESCHVYVYELMLRWQYVKLGRHHRRRREGGGGVGFFSIGEPNCITHA